MQPNQNMSQYQNNIPQSENMSSHQQNLAHQPNIPQQTFQHPDMHQQSFNQEHHNPQQNLDTPNSDTKQKNKNAKQRLTNNVEYAKGVAHEKLGVAIDRAHHGAHRAKDRIFGGERKKSSDRDSYDSSPERRDRENVHGQVHHDHFDKDVHNQGHLPGTDPMHGQGHYDHFDKDAYDQTQNKTQLPQNVDLQRQDHVHMPKIHEQGHHDHLNKDTHGNVYHDSLNKDTHEHEKHHLHNDLQGKSNFTGNHDYSNKDMHGQGHHDHFDKDVHNQGHLPGTDPMHGQGHHDHFDKDAYDQTQNPSHHDHLNKEHKVKDDYSDKDLYGRGNLPHNQHLHKKEKVEYVQKDIKKDRSEGESDSYPNEMYSMHAERREYETSTSEDDRRSDLRKHKDHDINKEHGNDHLRDDLQRKSKVIENDDHHSKNKDHRHEDMQNDHKAREMHERILADER
jgi:hypothetical protein